MEQKSSAKNNGLKPWHIIVVLIGLVLVFVLISRDEVLRAISKMVWNQKPQLIPRGRKWLWKSSLAIPGPVLLFYCWRKCWRCFFWLVLWPSWLPPWFWSAWASVLFGWKTEAHAVSSSAFPLLSSFWCFLLPTSKWPGSLLGKLRRCLPWPRQKAQLLTQVIRRAFLFKYWQNYQNELYYRVFIVPSSRLSPRLLAQIQ